MKNRDIFKILRQHVDDPASKLGFESQRNTTTDVTWVRKRSGRYDVVYCQLDKWAWDPWAGTKFTVNFQNSKKPGIGVSSGTKFARVGDVLRGKYKKAAEQIQNAAIAKIRVPSADEYEEEMGFADDFLLDEYKELSKPERFGRKRDDLWLRIVDADDAREWAEFIGAWLPNGLDQFDKLDGDEFIW